MAWKPTESRKAMKREVGDRINILGDYYSIVSFLGKGKGDTPTFQRTVEESAIL